MRKPVINKKVKIVFIGLLAIAFVTVAASYINSLSIDILNPKGVIAAKQYNLLVFTTILGFIVVVPVFIITIAIAWRYREGNTKAAYTPNASTNRLAETIWWGIPVVLIIILSIVTWISTYDLDPHKPLASNVKPLTVQVVALDWKWLFIYPEQNIATVNLVQFPVNTPVNFEITADAPMNSFWIPQLGGQIYAMAGMTTKLNLNATENGEYKGSSANISGEGFAGMKFTAKASSQTDFDHWVTLVKKSQNHLTNDEYDKLATKSQNNPTTYYASSAEGLYDTILMKYMAPAAHTDASQTNTITDDSHMNMDMKAH
jgi:cytochrome o ubiquinol oxidase subunit 2